MSSGLNFYQFNQKAVELEAQGKRLIRLNIGDTNLETPAFAVDAMINWISDHKAKYGADVGLRELREKAAKREGCGPENIVVGPGSKQLIYGLMHVLTRHGDAALLPAPTWPAYKLICDDLGINAVFHRACLEDGWKLRPSELPLDGTKVVVLCNPSNPTSCVYDPAGIDELVARAGLKNVAVIVDEAYKGLAFNPIPRFEGAIRVRSFSKEFSMEGWRLGYAVAPAEVVKKMAEYARITTTCVPEFIQRGGLACLDNEQEILESVKELWRRRIALMGPILRSIGFEFAEPAAGMYYFARHAKIKDAGEFAEKLLEAGVVIGSGVEFGGYDNFIRICVNQEEEVLKEAASIMREVLETLPR